MKKPASKVAEPAQIQPKSQFLFHKNLPPRDFSIMTLIVACNLMLIKFRFYKYCGFIVACIMRVPFCTWFWRLQCTFVSIFYRTSKRNIQHLTDWINALKWSPFVQKKMALGKKIARKKRVLFYEIEDGQILLSGIPVIYCCCTFGQPCHYHLIGKCLDNRFHLEFWFQILNTDPKFYSEFSFQCS